MRTMLNFRTLTSSPLTDVHDVGEDSVGPEGSEQRSISIPPKEEWTGRRKAKSTGVLLPRTARWIATLPSEFQPTQTAETFPRIANRLAALCSAPEELTNYLDELLVDKRGRRQGFPVRVVIELHALRAYNATILTARKLATRRRLAEGHTL